MPLLYVAQVVAKMTIYEDLSKSIALQTKEVDEAIKAFDEQKSYEMPFIFYSKETFQVKRSYAF